VWILAGLSLLVVVALVAYLLVQKADQRAADAAGAAAEAGRAHLEPADVLAVPHLVVRNTASGPSHGDVALVPLDDLNGPRAMLDVSCDRVSAVPAGGLCLQTGKGLVSGYQAAFLDRNMKPGATVELGGLPSRVRVSADGSYSASTAFVNGHAYSQAGFSTETIVYDRSGAALGNLENWAATGTDGKPVDAVDRNYWGVSFVGDGPAFYATLGLGTRTFLIRGDASRHTMTVVAENGQCPSVSPSGRTVVYKQTDSATGDMRFVALDVASGRLTTLSETRPVDDQAAWLDEDTILYTLPQGLSSLTDFDIWAAPIDGGPARRVVTDAAFPSVVRP
jgi:dipeptidyl aminopeptidase/acylaminoacyl peptidase